MKHHTVTVICHTPAAPQAVWNLLADSATWPDWSPVRVMSIERSAPDGGDGVGAIRSLKTALATSRDNNAAPATTTTRKARSRTAPRRCGAR